MKSHHHQVKLATKISIIRIASTNLRCDTKHFAGASEELKPSHLLRLSFRVLYPPDPLLADPGAALVIFRLLNLLPNHPSASSKNAVAFSQSGPLNPTASILISPVVSMMISMVLFIYTPMRTSLMDPFCCWRRSTDNGLNQIPFDFALPAHDCFLKPTIILRTDDPLAGEVIRAIKGGDLDSLQRMFASGAN